VVRIDSFYTASEPDTTTQVEGDARMWKDEIHSILGLLRRCLLVQRRVYVGIHLLGLLDDGFTS
jgi:hypothetical protein